MVLYAWPSQSVTASIKIGQVVPRTLVGVTVSASSGGIVNMEVDASYQGHEVAFFFPRQLVPAGTGMALAVASQAAVPQMSPQAADLTIDRVQAPASGTPLAAPSPDFGCTGAAPVATWNNQQTVLGGEFSHLDSVKMDFSYSTGSSSTLGAAVDQAGVVGWSASGTYTIGAGGTQNWPDENVANGYNRKSGFQYTEYVDTCGNHTTHVTDWNGGNSTATTGFLSAGKCSVEYATPGKVTVELDKTTAWTFGAGVSIASKIGINLSAETGYTATASEGYWFTDTAHTRYLCGKNNYPLSSNPGPGYVVAGANPHGGS